VVESEWYAEDEEKCCEEGAVTRCVCAAGGGCSGGCAHFGFLGSVVWLFHSVLHGLRDSCILGV
jgi:hypothetical protein